MTQLLPTMPTTLPVTRWRIATIGLVVSFAVLGIVYWETFSSIVAIWLRSGTFAHGFLVVPIVAYLVWGKRRELLLCEPRATPWPAVLLLLLSVFWLLAHVADIIGVQQLAVVAMIPALAWSVLGFRAVRVLAFPLSYLFFTVPFGEFLVPVLQDFTAIFVVNALQMIAVPVYLEGRFFFIPSGSFEVAAACSGVRYLIASLALGVLYAYLTYHTLWRRVAFVALAIVVPIVANGVRAFGIVLIADLSDYELAVGVDHLIYGWLFFGLVMLLMFWIGSLFRERVPAEGKPLPTDVTARRDPVALKNVLPIVPVLLLIPTGPLVAAWLERAPASPSVSLTLPSGVGGWEGPLPVQRPLGAQYHGADAQVAGEYRQDGRAVQLYVAYYARQRQGAELISSNNSVFDGAIWHATDGYQTRIVLADGKERPAHAMLLRSGGARRLVWQWYMVGDRVTASPIQVKLYEMQSRLSGANPGSAVVILAADFDTDAGQAQDTLRQFSAAILPAVQVMLGVAQ